jgi:hypothetical protein
MKSSIRKERSEQTAAVEDWGALVYVRRRALPSSCPGVRRGLGRANEHGRERIAGPVLSSQRRGVRSRLTETPRDCASPRVP